MKIVKKAAAIIVMILSAVLLLAMLAGVVGVWWGQGQVRGVVADLSTTANNALERAEGASEQVNKVVGLSQGRVDQMVTQHHGGRNEGRGDQGRAGRRREVAGH